MALHTISYGKLLSWVWLTLLVVDAKGGLTDAMGRNFNEACSDTHPCNAIKYLECQNGVCGCISPAEISFDPETNQCTARAGFSCLRQIPGDKPLGGTDDPPKYQIACTSNAKCSYPEDICECEFRYYKLPDGRCKKQHAHGERCQADEECDKLKFLTCMSGTCNCDKAHRYDQKNQKCIVTVGTPCKIIDYFSLSEEHYNADECPDHATCVPQSPESDRGECQCNPGLKLASDKTCGRDYGDKCDTDNKCSDVQFACRDGFCRCKYPLHQYFNEETKKCVSLVGGPCDSPNAAEDPLTECTDNALCQEGTPFNGCRCQNGYVETNEGHCVQGYGSPCHKDDECDPLVLACVDNTCACPDKLQTYDDKQRVCLSLAGGRCKKEANSTAPVCIPSAYCVKANAQLVHGRCTCVRGTTTTSTRLCSKS